MKALSVLDELVLQDGQTQYQAGLIWEDHRREGEKLGVEGAIVKPTYSEKWMTTR